MLKNLEDNKNPLMELTKVRLNNELRNIFKDSGKKASEINRATKGAGNRGVSQAWLCKWKSGQHDFEIDTIARIAKVLGYKVELRKLKKKK